MHLLEKICRKEMIEYCKTHKIDVEASASKPYSMDRNLWLISYEAGILEDPWFDPTEICTNYLLTQLHG